MDRTARVGSFVGKDSNCAKREVVLDTRREPEARESLWDELSDIRRACPVTDYRDTVPVLNRLNTGVF